MTTTPTPSAPLTPEEVEQLLAAIKERTALAREMEDSGYDEIELKTWMVIWADMYIRHLQSQLQSYREDAERCVRLLRQACEFSDTGGCGCDDNPDGIGTRCCCGVPEYMPHTPDCEFMATLSSLHHIYPPKP